MKILKKIGSILFCLLPVLLAFGIQIVVTFAGVFAKMLVLLADGSLAVRGSSLAGLDNAIYQISSDSQFLAGITAVYAILAAAALGIWYKVRFVPKHTPRRRASSIVNPHMLGGLILLMLGMQYLSSYMVMLIAAIRPAWFQTYQSMMEGIGFGDMTPLLAVYTVLIAPISEELIFRGVTLKYASRAMPFFMANIFQSVLFGAFHGNMVQGIYAFVAGLFCGYVCHKGGSLYLSVLFHMMFNLWGAFAPEALSYGGNSIGIHLAVVTAAAGITVAGFFLYRKGIQRREAYPCH
ncbi:MAG: CPBP family intramembrane metalloprotease [Lachnospiraceae bacterium]|nr:CPBP family intramembrane metalloprotease [Lachnospiraceae bacterium]